MVFYFCPDINLQSSGIRLLYQHVAILNRHGYETAILHEDTGFCVAGMPSVPISYISAPNTLKKNDYSSYPPGML